VEWRGQGVQGSDFGLSKEDGLIAFKALVVPHQGSGGPLWMPLQASLKHPVPNLQSVQNACLRTVTGCHATVSQQHLHDECQVLSVKEHVSMQCR
jgi:hypothetical protein